MNIELIKAILHVLDPAVDAPILSEAILPPSEDALQYLAGHAAKCFASDEAKACTLADDSPFLPLLWNIEEDFEKKTATIAGDWFRVMQENPAIPAGDAAFLLLEIDGAEYLAALKRGDYILTGGGIYGRIMEVHGDKLTVEIAKDLNIEINRGFVSGPGEGQAAAAKSESKKDKSKDKE